MKLEIRKTGSGVELEFTAEERFEGWHGVVHGGIVCTILDELMVWACTNQGYESMTAAIEVRFRQPLLVGQKVKGLGRVVRERGRLVQTESRLVDTAGNLIAEATGKMMKV